MKLSDEEAELLLTIMRREFPELIPRVILNGIRALAAHPRARLSEAVANELQSRGFSRAWEPTRRGVQLEHIIDLISTIEDDDV